jgi:hypothetical protein
MTEAGSAIDASVLRARLSEEWRVEDGSAGVYGYADDDGTRGLLSSGRVPACFSIQPDGSLWAATWKGSHELGADPRAVSERVTGTKERCVEWVIERARRAEKQAGE